MQHACVAHIILLQWLGDSASSGPLKGGLLPQDTSVIHDAQFSEALCSAAYAV